MWFFKFFFIFASKILNNCTMKKIFTFVFAIALGFNVFAQCPITTAVDFTATDVHGTEVHLFDILAGGQYVLIDFFFTTCGPCQQAVPKIVESYYSFGCNQHDVYYIEIATGDSETACLNWVNTYGVEYPTISGAAGGTSICSSYGIQAYPTVILIAPSHDIVIQDLWPISNAQTVITALENHGIQQYECGAAYPEVTISVDQVLETEVTVTFTPNEDCASYYYMMGTETEFEQWMAATGLDMPDYLQTYGFPGEYEISQTFTELEPNTDYMIYAVPADADGNLYEVVQELVTTTAGGDDIMADFTGTDVDGNEINLYSILDGGQAVLIHFFLNDDESSQINMPYVNEAYRAFGCNQHDVYFMGVCANAEDEACMAWMEANGVNYPTISTTGNATPIVQSIPVAYYPTVMIIRPDYTIAIRDLYPIEDEQTIINALLDEGYEQHECEESVDEADAETFVAYPNPANDFMKIFGENLGNVSIYNVFGQKIEEFEAHDELNVATSNFEDGVYFVKVGAKTQKFVVRH